MPWAFVDTVKGASLDDYEKVAAELGAENVAPDGLLVHVAGEFEGDLRVIEVWDSQQQYERFRDGQLIPAMVRVLGGNGAFPPEVVRGHETMDVHTLFPEQTSRQGAGSWRAARTSASQARSRLTTVATSSASACAAGRRLFFFFFFFFPPSARSMSRTSWQNRACQRRAARSNRSGSFSTLTRTSSSASTGPTCSIAAAARAPLGQSPRIKRGAQSGI